MRNHTLIERLIHGLMIIGIILGVLFVFSGVVQVSATADQIKRFTPTQVITESEPAINILRLTHPSVFLADGLESSIVSSNSQAAEVYRSNILKSSGSGLPVVGILPSAAEISVSPTEINSKQNHELVTLPLSISNLGNEALDWQLFEGEVGWSDNFDSYTTGFQLDGQGGWSGWGNDPTAGALTSDVQARSIPNSVDIFGDSDLIHPYSGSTTGVWIFTAWQYIPNDFAGTTYFILLNTYTDGESDTNWSAQVIFNSVSGELFNEGPANGTLPIIKGQWVEIRDEIDLDADTQTFYYGGEILFSDSWTEGMTGGGALNIAAVDLFADGASSIFYDDISLSQVMDIPWLSSDPNSGTTVPGEPSNVDVMLDATGLDLGSYTSTLFVSSNDPLHPMIAIPVRLSMRTLLYIPFIQR
jgi:hypothetical protein